ncbi:MULTISPECIES: nitroreductase family deazaflavin-dependent oxidoreductase [Mycolicibacterium]|uniref:nitroreductase family deazaflavin-dependent oxidoreductase n=1 Tax=Mycolicibacterium monacense TaxID=85693 RepID=UPI0007EB29A7|nr:nitroreductase family deazaflavin-dependent oxidoreductase [Mycolicibacterium monacense]OBB64993.1 nitroreductase [Mycolicibacterium monacense]
MSDGVKTRARDVVRTFNKYVLNPVMRLPAGRKHWYASVIRHTGRRSGKTYTTPVVAEQVADGFVIPLPYGTDVDWLRNVVTAGRATIVSGGRTVEVVDPQVIDAATAAPHLSARRRRTFERFGIERFVRLMAAPAGHRTQAP